VAVDAAVVRRIADRAADVAPGLEAGEPRRKRRPPRRPEEAAGRARRVPGVHRLAVHRVVRFPVGKQGGHVRLAEDVGARAQEALHRQGIARATGVLVLGKAPSAGMALDVEGLFHRHRQAGERSGFRACRPDLRSKGARALSRRVEVQHAERIQAAVMTGDALGVEIEQFERADFLSRAARG